MAKATIPATPPANGFVASLARELAYAVEDIRHKVVEEGWFGRQVTPSTFPRDEPPMSPLNLYGPDGPGIHGPDAPRSGPPTGGPLAERGLEGEILGPEGPPPRDALPPADGPPLIDVEPATWQGREAARLEFLNACRELSQSSSPDDPGPDRSRQIAGPDR